MKCLFFRRLLLSLLFVAVATPRLAMAQSHDHGEVERPKVYLDKSARIVEYQLKRLDNARLLLVETKTDDVKYLPVFKAILLRSGLSRQNRDEALAGLVAINKTDVATELLVALESLDGEDKEEQRVGRQLSAILLSQPKDVLTGRLEELKQAMSASGVLQSTGFAGMIVAGEAAEAWQQAQVSADARVSYLAAVSLVPAGDLRDSLRDNVVSCLADDQDVAVRAAAIRTMATFGVARENTFERLADLVSQEALRTPAVRSLLKIPAAQRPVAAAKSLTNVLVKIAEATPAAKRTTNEFLDAMQLADELLARLPADDARAFRKRLQEVVVRVVRLHTVEEEMRYDKTYFAVEAGRPVQVVLENEDLMPHNLVITKTGTLKNVALEGAALGTTPGLDGKLYVPNSSDVLFATTMVNAGSRELLTFTAPTEPGEYPYVCTFPRHWMRMYGVMVVVPDLDEWQRNPVEPKDPLGNTRKLVQNWKLDDFDKQTIKTSISAPTSLGERLFKEATCLGCHKMNGQGGAVGPELTDVAKRWKGDHYGILREILEPSYRIEPKYAVKMVIDLDGKPTSGIVTAEDKKSISLLENPEAKEPKVIMKDNIEEIIPSSTSMMPKALLDKFTREEILEILAYISRAGEGAAGQ
ncbi:MAG: plastocyanin/azurin family copper-binding protein [Planctomycetaceae bacterium]|nr:plastocyanin/azurin family copper-binding protein [Planctomycetaceae bacterium]